MNKERCSGICIWIGIVGGLHPLNRPDTNCVSCFYGWCLHGALAAFDFQFAAREG